MWIRWDELSERNSRTSPRIVFFSLLTKTWGRMSGERRGMKWDEGKNVTHHWADMLIYFFQKRHALLIFHYTRWNFRRFEICGLCFRNGARKSIGKIYNGTTAVSIAFLNKVYLWKMVESYLTVKLRRIGNPRGRWKEGWKGWRRRIDNC